MNPSSSHGAQLAEIRKQLGLTQARLSVTTGLPRGRISQIECGETVSLDVLRAYVAGLGGEVDVIARIGRTWIAVACGEGSVLGQALEGADGDVGAGRVPERRERPA